VGRQVAWAETAWRDLERIADYIAEDSPGYAAAFVRRVRILGLIHGARDLAALWDKEGRSEPGAG
jgi:hypothetical protein